MNVLSVPAWHYQQFDADHDLEIPALGYGGWKKEELPFCPEKTALVVMHAWDCKTRAEFPGWHRAVEYNSRAEKIGQTVLPRILMLFRDYPIPVFHVAANATMAGPYPGYRLVQESLEKHGGVETRCLPPPKEDEVSASLKRFRLERIFPGKHNIPDIERGFSRLDFMREAMPLHKEPVSIDSDGLHAVCLDWGVNHLLYVGFAINWCLQYSPGNMNSMSDRGFLCSTIREGVTAVENRESAPLERHKEYGLWTTALKNGFVYDMEDLVACLS